LDSTQNKRLLSAAAIVMSSVIVSRITGFLREMLIPVKIGVNQVADAYNIAFLIPDLMYNLIIGGAIAAALIPVLSGYLKRDMENEGWKAISTFINIAIIMMLVLSTLGMIFAPHLIPLAASGYGRETPERLDLAVRITRIMFPSVSFIMMAGMCNGVLNSYQKFAVAAYGPSIYNILSALSILFLSNNNVRDNFGIESIAFGVLGSALAYFLFQLGFTLKHMKNYELKINLRHEGFKKLFSLALPALAASSIIQINIIVLVSFSSRFAPGSITALKMADRTWQMPLGIIAQSLGIAALPTLSRLFAVNDIKRFKATFKKSFNTVLMLVIPTAVGFIILREPIIRAIFQFGNRIDNNDVIITSGILMFYAIAIVGQSAATFLNRSFYSINNTKIPLLTGLSSILINIILCFTFYNYTSLGVAGMALSYSLASLINGFLLFFLFNLKTRIVKYKNFLIFIAKLLAASLLMGLFLCVFQMLHNTAIDSKIIQVLYLAFEIITGVVIYGAAAILLRISEVEYILNIVKKKLYGLKQNI
jgi:putative peptidoglycan lipid II flippase